MTSVTKYGDHRFEALDGLRGVAAMVVLCSHVLLASNPALAGAYVGSGPHAFSFAWALTFTPLHVLWAGQDWVMVFFVLSGFVLSLGGADGRPFVGRSYYPKRLLRLYLPVWGALLFAALLRVAIDRHVVGGATWWLNAHAAPVTARDVSGDALLVFAGHWSLAPALWSLKWEILFSLLLPVFLLVGVRTRRWPVAVAVVALLLAAVSSGNDFAYYGPAFLIGSLLAFQREHVSALAQALDGSNARRGALAALAAVLLTAGWWLRPDIWLSPGVPQSVLDGLRSAFVVAGAALIVVLSFALSSFSRMLTRSPMKWLGKRSFSLYLVHEPVVVALAFALGGRPAVPVLAALALPAALLAAEVFHRCVERPSHRLARRAGGQLGSVGDAPSGSRSRLVPAATEAQTTP
jgi:peptidoglycan/LPS O-acetylase OafA/YrhL